MKNNYHNMLWNIGITTKLDYNNDDKDDDVGKKKKH